MAGVTQRRPRSTWRGVLSSPALTLNGYVAFALPRTVTALGMSLLLGLGAVHVYIWATRPALPNYFLVYSAVLIVGCLTATSAMAWGVNPRVPRLGWYLGSSICLAFLVVYLASRVVGLPGLDTLTTPPWIYDQNTGLVNGHQTDWNRGTVRLVDDGEGSGCADVGASAAPGRRGSRAARSNGSCVPTSGAGPHAPGR